MSDFIKTAVIGHPISHSKSPLIHNHWIAQHGLNGSYEAIDISAQELAVCMKDLIAQGYAGWNVTIPHKEAVFALCDHVDESAQAMGAVNMVAIKDGKIHGKNTDGFGFIQNIKSAHPDFDFTNGPAHILGAGGAARAILHALLKAGVPHIALSNRTRSRAEELAAMNPETIKVIEWNDDAPLLHSNLLVNTTSLGMKGHPDLELDLSGLNPKALVTDIVYSPLQTRLLRRASQQGNPTVTGIGMLLHQARPAFECWYGIAPHIDAELEAKVLS